MYALATWWLLLVFTALLFYRGFSLDICFTAIVGGMALYQLFLYGYENGNQSCGYLAISLLGFLPFLLAISIALQIHREKYYSQCRDIFLGFSVVLAGIGLLLLYTNIKQSSWIIAYRISWVAIVVLSLLFSILTGRISILIVAILAACVCFGASSWVFMLLIAVFVWIEPSFYPVSELGNPK